MIGEDFKFGSRWLSDYQMIMGEPEESQEFVSRNIERGEITSVRSRPNHYSIVYDDVLRLNFFIMKKDGCERQEGFRMSGDDIHFIRSWLESPKRPTELRMPLNEDELTTYYYGLFTNVQPYIIDGDCYGLTLEFTCDSPYGYSEEQVLSYEIDGSSSEIQDEYMNISAELNEYTTPIVTIYSSNTFGSDESLSITNNSDDNQEMTVTLPEGLSSIKIDCDKKIVTDENGNLVSMDKIGINNPITDQFNLISTESYLFYWFSLIPGNNEITITPSNSNTISKVEISIRYIIKSGGF